MRLIESLEGRGRGPYAGAVGYLSDSGDVDTAITIRSAFVNGDRIYLQAGAGIVLDSVPEKEFQECQSKLGAMHRSLKTMPGGRGMRSRVLLVDNYDSFVYNLAHSLAVAGAEPDVVRNDRLDLEAVKGTLSGYRHISWSGASGQPYRFRHVRRAAAHAFPDHPHARRLPRASGHRPCLRRECGPGADAPPWKDHAHKP